MEKIKFNKSENIYDVDIIRLKEGVIIINSNKVIAKNILISGFTIINEFTDAVMDEYNNYNTFYKDYNTKENVYYISTREVYIAKENK